MGHISHFRLINSFVQKLTALILVAFSLSACALPPVIEVASLVLGGGSWLVTGKGLSDHAVSAAVDKDCAMVRPVIGQKFCLTHEEAALLEDEADPIAVGGLRLKGIEQIQQIGGGASYVTRDLETEIELTELASVEMDAAFHTASEVSHDAPGGDWSSDINLDALKLDALAESLNQIETAAGGIPPVVDPALWGSSQGLGADY